MNQETLLAIIGSTEETTFRELCSALGSDCPERGDREAWRDLFDELRRMERDGLIEVSRNGSQMDGFILTEAGASAAREATKRRREEMDSRRPLFRDDNGDT